MRATAVRVHAEDSDEAGSADEGGADKAVSADEAGGADEGGADEAGGTEANRDEAGSSNKSTVDT